MSEIYCTSAYAKLNLFMHILGVYDDGYHEVESAVVFLEFADQLTIKLIDANDHSVTVVDHLGHVIPINLENNLVYKALCLFCERFAIQDRFQIMLEKKIPIGAGLGGGSADAGAVLRYLVSKYVGSINITKHDIVTIATNLGADVLMCFYSKSCFMYGKGYDLSSFSPPKLPIIVIYHANTVSTTAVYRALNLTEYDKSIKFLFDEHSFALEDIKNLLRFTHNILLPIALNYDPQIQVLLDQLKSTNPWSFGMSGSGGACFAIYNNYQEASVAYQLLRNNANLSHAHLHLTSSVV